MDSTLIKKASLELGLPTTDIEEYLEFDFPNEQPDFDELVSHIEYQETVCMAEDPSTAFTENY